MLDGTLEQLAAYAGGGISLATAYWVNAQALKRAGLIPDRLMPLINLAVSVVIVVAFYWSEPAFQVIAGTLTLGAMFTLAHGGAKHITNGSDTRSDAERAEDQGTGGS